MRPKRVEDILLDAEGDIETAQIHADGVTLTGDLVVAGERARAHRLRAWQRQ